MASDNDPRKSHPYFMYEHIVAQPAAFGEVAARNRSPLVELAAAISSCRKLFLVGIGTSLHAAQIAGHLFRLYAKQIDCQAWHSTDFSQFGPDIANNDCVVAVSHRGSKRFTIESLEQAINSGCQTAMIAGVGAHPEIKVNHHFQTVEQEKSSAHTVSQVGSIAVLSELVRQVAAQNGTEVLSAKLLEHTIPACLSDCLCTEQQMATWATAHCVSRRLWIIGSGPTAITAREIALKIKETSYLQAEGMSVEELLHGPFQCCDSDDSFVLLAPRSGTQHRMEDLETMVDDVGARCVVVTDELSAFPATPAEYKCVLPTVPVPFEAATCLIPMQLFTYHLAIQRKTNPDSFRLEDPRFSRALGRIKL